MAAPVAKNEELELDVESLAYGGNGVARLDGFVVFVRRGLAGRPRPRARHEGEARLRRGARDRGRSGPGPQRVEAPCAHFPACGGCRFQDLAYEAQLEQKHAQVRDALQRLGGIRRAAARGDRPVRAGDLPLPQQARVLVHAHAGRACARLPPGRPLGRGARARALLAHDRPRQRPPRRRARLGARGGARGVLAGGRQRLPPPPRRARGAQHRPGARAARHGARREVRAGILRRGRRAGSRRSARCTGR